MEKRDLKHFSLAAGMAMAICVFTYTGSGKILVLWASPKVFLILALTAVLLHIWEAEKICLFLIVKVLMLLQGSYYWWSWSSVFSSLWVAEKLPVFLHLLFAYGWLQELSVFLPMLVRGCRKMLIFCFY
jgi:hypothetical protein